MTHLTYSLQSDSAGPLQRLTIEAEVTSAVSFGALSGLLFAQAIEGFDGVKSVDAVTGPYDIIAVLDCPDLQAIGDLLTKHVHKIAGITRTVTCLCIKVS